MHLNRIICAVIVGLVFLVCAAWIPINSSVAKSEEAHHTAPNKSLNITGQQSALTSHNLNESDGYDDASALKPTKQIQPKQEHTYHERNL